MTGIPTLTPSQEDYLEAIYHLEIEHDAARSKDIAERLNVRRASVTGALRNLALLRLVNYRPYSVVTLTPLGRQIAQDIIQRHEALREFFISILDVEPTLADDCACKMEHSLPPEILDRLVRFIAQAKRSGGR